MGKLEARRGPRNKRGSEAEEGRPERTSQHDNHTVPLPQEHTDKWPGEGPGGAPLARAMGAAGAPCPPRPFMAKGLIAVPS